MFQQLVNSIPDTTIFFVTIGGCMLYPISAPIFIFTAMMVSCCKSPNFLDDEYQTRDNIRDLMLDGEINDSDVDKDSDVDNQREDNEKHIINTEPTNKDDLVMAIDKLKEEINTLKNNNSNDEDEVDVDKLIKENNKNEQSKKDD